MSQFLTKGSGPKFTIINETPLKQEEEQRHCGRQEMLVDSGQRPWCLVKTGLLNHVRVGMDCDQTANFKVNGVRQPI